MNPATATPPAPATSPEEGLAETVAWLCSQPGRGPGTDAERRSAIAVRDRLRERGRTAGLQTIWVRPHWPWTHALHCLLGVGGSIVSVWEPIVGGAILAATLISFAGDLSGRWALVRLLTPRRATQNVVSPPPASQAAKARLVIAAHLDAGRTGAVYGVWAGLEARLRQALRGHLASPLGWLATAILVLLGVAVARWQGVSGTALGVAQFLPTVALLIGFASLVDVGLSDFSPGASANASAVAVALALAHELDRAPPRRLAVEVVLAGAGEAPAAGVTAYARSLRRSRRPEDTVVLGIEACGTGTPRWLTRDGPLAPLRLHPQLIALAERAAHAEAPHARPFASHGSSPAWPPRRVARWPAIAIGCRDERDAVPRAHTPEDTPAQIDPGALRAALDFGLVLVGFIDDHLDRVTGDLVLVGFIDDHLDRVTGAAG